VELVGVSGDYAVSDGVVSPGSIYDFQCLGGGRCNILRIECTWCVIPVVVCGYRKDVSGQAMTTILGDGNRMKGQGFLCCERLDAVRLQGTMLVA